MKILIIGSTSVVGRALCGRLGSLGEVTLAGRRDASLQLDLSRTDAISDLEEVFDVVVHVAADFGGESDADFVRAELVNAVGTLTMCQLAHHVRARHIVLISSLSATYQPGDPYYGIYSLSKRHGEEVAEFFCRARSIPLTILRPTQIYDDAGECRRHQGFLYMLADRAQAGHDIVIHGTHDPLRNYIHIEDFTEVCRRVIEEQIIGTYYCGHPKSVRASEIAGAAFAAFGRGGRLNFLKEKPDLPDLAAREDFSLYDRLGFTPLVDISAGLARIKHYREGSN